ncbi:hypothetical protein AUT26_08565 [[Arthrobacter] sp. ATCC 21022]|nr:hypothetical protein AUT26_08565 [Arthrobacter sp. ATCC 21022]KUR63471.1 hypothetical protein JM67_17180 [Arthrobacter sp. ATCC 21022]
MDRWVKPQEFVDHQNFLGVMSGPMVRSSYRAGRLWATAMRKKGWEIPAALADVESSGTTRQEASTILATQRPLTTNPSEPREGYNTPVNVRASLSAAVLDPVKDRPLQSWRISPR